MNAHPAAIETKRGTASDLELRIPVQIEIERFPENFDQPLVNPIASLLTSTPKASGLKMPKISGKYKNWILFYHQFIFAVDKNESIPDIQKSNF